MFTIHYTNTTLMPGLKILRNRVYSLGIDTINVMVCSKVLGQVSLQGNKMVGEY